MIADEMRLHLLGCLLLGACTFDTSGLASRDVPRVDHPARDGPAPILDVLTDVARLDQAPADQPPADSPDAKPVDRSTADKPKPDAKKPDSSLPSCLAKYGSAGIPAYKDCGGTATSCVFYFSGSDNCTNMCAKGGGTCIKSAADSSDGCATYEDLDCAYNHGDGVCHCSR